jgi:UDP-2,3-diacylglucosamine hydrolase
MSAALTSLQDKQAQPQWAALFISDLHLSPDMPHTAEAFFNFLNTKALQTQTLYLLGDIFEYWAGDDDINDEFNQSIVNALAALSKHGIKIYWLAGNRDFLVGNKFADACGLQILNEPVINEIAGKKILLLHGDAQCIDDTAYMTFRAQVRDTAWQQHFLNQDLQQRKALIAAMRAGSKDAQKNKSIDIMDVNLAAIDTLFESHQVSLMIHGHTHRPHQHQHQTKQGVCTRFVLPDWDYDAVKTRGGWLGINQAGEFSLVTDAEPTFTP